LKKVCISNQTLALDGSEVGKLVCENSAQFPGIYSALGNAFDQAPSWMQNRLCNLTGFAVYTPEPASVLSWSYFEKDGFIGISKTRLDQAYDMNAQAATMMKQAKKFKTVPEGVVFPADFGLQASAPDAGSAVLYLMAHEMGHIIYNSPDKAFAKKYFSECTLIWDSLACSPFTATQFGFLDWITGSGEISSIIRGQIKPENKALRDLVTADASVAYTPQVAERFFEDLFASHFTTAFALYSPEEDFCETVAQIVVSEKAAPLYFQKLNGGQVNVWDRIKKPAEAGLKKKIDFVNSILHAKDQD
jgi:hypothetical protein